MQEKSNGQECTCGDLGFNFNLAVESASCHPSQCKAVDGQPPLSLRAGTTHTLLLQARDKYGNECKGNTGDFSTDLVGHNVQASGARSSVQQQGQQFAANFSAQKAGNYGLEVKVQGKHIAGSPFPVEVRPGDLAPRRCKAAGGGLKTSTPAVCGTFTINAYDEYGNPRNGRGDTDIFTGT